MSQLVHSVRYSVLLRGCEEARWRARAQRSWTSSSNIDFAMVVLDSQRFHPGCIRKPCRGLSTHQASTQYPHKAWHGPPLTCSCTPADTHNPTPLPLAPPHVPSQSVPVSQIRMAREQQDEPEEDRKHEYPKEYPGVELSSCINFLQQDRASIVWLVARSGTRHPETPTSFKNPFCDYTVRKTLARCWIFLEREQAT